MGFKAEKKYQLIARDGCHLTPGKLAAKLVWVPQSRAFKSYMHACT